MEDHPSICVWHACSSSTVPGLVERVCENWLNQEERIRADRFRQSTSRNQHVVGRGMARRLLGRDRIDPKAICFAAAKYGKPYVTEPAEAQLPFNVAHTDGLVMCGIGNRIDDLVGIDVEKLDRRTDPGLANRYFSAPEIRFLENYQSDADRRNAFLRIWTLKEAFIKAIGTGLQTPLADFAFEEIDSERPHIRMLNQSLESNTEWSFMSIEPRPGYIGAVAVGAVLTGAVLTKREAGVTLRRFEDLLV
jgi:4'-phosphopantetheinyl transferase